VLLHSPSVWVQQHCSLKSFSAHTKQGTRARVSHFYHKGHSWAERQFIFISYIPLRFYRLCPLEVARCWEAGPWWCQLLLNHILGQTTSMERRAMWTQAGLQFAICLQTQQVSLSGCTAVHALTRSQAHRLTPGLFSLGFVLMFGFENFHAF
jgi:hypothetical protein